MPADAAGITGTLQLPDGALPGPPAEGANLPRRRGSERGRGRGAALASDAAQRRPRVQQEAIAPAAPAEGEGGTTSTDSDYHPDSSGEDADLAGMDLEREDPKILESQDLDSGDLHGAGAGSAYPCADVAASKPGGRKRMAATAEGGAGRGKGAARGAKRARRGRAADAPGTADSADARVEGEAQLEGEGKAGAAGKGRGRGSRRGRGQGRGRGRGRGRGGAGAAEGDEARGDEEDKDKDDPWRVWGPEDEVDPESLVQSRVRNRIPWMPCLQRRTSPSQAVPAIYSLTHQTSPPSPAAPFHKLARHQMCRGGGK